jgi:hypothetical protein
MGNKEEGEHAHPNRHQQGAGLGEIAAARIDFRREGQ